MKTDLVDFDMEDFVKRYEESSKRNKVKGIHTLHSVLLASISYVFKKIQYSHLMNRTDSAAFL